MRRAGKDAPPSPGLVLLWSSLCLSLKAGSERKQANTSVPYQAASTNNSCCMPAGMAP